MELRREQTWHGPAAEWSGAHHTGAEPAASTSQNTGLDFLATLASHDNNAAPSERWRTPHPRARGQVARRPRNVDGHAGAAGERSLWRASRHPAPRQLERDFRREHERDHDLPVSTRGQQQRCDSTAKPRARAECAPAKLDGRRRGRAWAAAPPVLQLPQRQGLVRPPPPVHSLRSAVHRRNLRAASDRAARPPSHHSRLLQLRDLASLQQQQASGAVSEDEVAAAAAAASTYGPTEDGRASVASTSTSMSCAPVDVTDGAPTTATATTASGVDIATMERNVQLLRRQLLELGIRPCVDE